MLDKWLGKLRGRLSILAVIMGVIIGALSGFGQMASCAAAELLAAYVAGAEPPAYAPAFRLDRYQDPVYRALLTGWSASGQRLSFARETAWREKPRAMGASSRAFFARSIAFSNWPIS